jgi:predicted membrane protein
VDVFLPEDATNLSVNARTGAGNVVVHVPSGVAARIHATTGLGKAIVDPRFSKIDDKTYQSPDFASAANKVEITASSGAGNVEVNTN